MDYRKLYAGVGSRETPPDILDLMRNIGRELAKKGWVLRSGAADGADSAFERGCDEVLGQKEIFLPYKGFRGHKSTLCEPPTFDALHLASTVHPYFSNMKPNSFARNAHARNMNQVLGLDLATPVNCVVCYTPDGAESEEDSKDLDITGGTRSAIVIAARKSIPVFNLARPDGLTRLVKFINKNELLPRTEWSANSEFLKEIKNKKIKARNDKKKKL